MIQSNTYCILNATFSLSKIKKVRYRVDPLTSVGLRQAGGFLVCVRGEGVNVCRVNFTERTGTRPAGTAAPEIIENIQPTLTCRPRTGYRTG